MNDILIYSIYIFFGVLPSFLWLKYYLRKDIHPEPRLMILKTFFYGILATIPAIFIERLIFVYVGRINVSYFLTTLLTIFIGVALVEEFLKFLVVKTTVLKNTEFDEPVDAMIYMIVASLGFAAGENILILVSNELQSISSGVVLSGGTILLGEILQISILRFLGATFLHALAGAVFGYFIGLSFLRKREGQIIKQRYQQNIPLLIIGLLLAILLHGFYNFSIINIGDSFQILIPFILLLISAIFVSFGFNHLKRMAGKTSLKK
jgi:RsiW-degrading membrane proteinase PrsW (M82 family)